MDAVSTKIFKGFSTCFRQWRADHTHCKFLHGYSVYFKVYFAGQIDKNNWVFDFGGMKRASAKIDGMSPSDYFNWLLDHTTIISKTDPHLIEFSDLNDKGVIQLRILDEVGCEKFAEFLIDKINVFLNEETNGRVRAIKLEFFENENNSAIARRA